MNLPIADNCQCCVQPIPFLGEERWQKKDHVCQSWEIPVLGGSISILSPLILYLLDVRRVCPICTFKLEKPYIFWNPYSRGWFSKNQNLIWYTFPEFPGLFRLVPIKFGIRYDGSRPPGYVEGWLRCQWKALGTRIITWLEDLQTLASGGRWRP